MAPYSSLLFDNTNSCLRSNTSDSKNQVTAVPLFFKKYLPFTPKQGIKTVSFALKPKVSPVLHVNDYIEAERAATWYTMEEFLAMKGEIKFILSVPKSNVEFDDVISRRGLEHRTGNGARKKRANRASGFTAVMNEQNLQRDCDEYQPQRIAELYVLATYHCRVDAHVRALEDEKDAR